MNRGESKSAPLRVARASSVGAQVVALPRGARDLLPDACRLRRAITGQLVATFERWGFSQVMTPVIEYAEVVGRGISESDRERCVRFIEAGSGDLLALRADLTQQVARMVAQRLGGELPTDAVVRFCYAADVVRHAEGRRAQAEQHQAGVELIGDPAPGADAELLALCHEALENLGLVDVRLDVAHTGVVGALVEGLGLSEDELATVRTLLARKDGRTLDAVLGRAGVPADRRRIVAELCDRFGPPAMLEQARRELTDPGVRACLDRLADVLAALERDDPRASGKITIDLGEARGFDYYTGLRVRVWAPGVSEPIVRGGRYDDLLGHYGAPMPATGFAFDLDALEAALAHAGIQPGAATTRDAHAVVLAPGLVDGAARALAAARARGMRASGRRSWVEVGLELDRAQALAEGAGASSLTYIDGPPGALQSSDYRRTELGWEPSSGTEGDPS